jgi:hypothetical protein
MVMDAVVERCVEQSRVTVMTRLALQRALKPAWIGELFERAGGTQYIRELLFPPLCRHDDGCSACRLGAI